MARLATAQEKTAIKNGKIQKLYFLLRKKEFSSIIKNFHIEPNTLLYFNQFFTKNKCLSSIFLLENCYLGSNLDLKRFLESVSGLRWQLKLNTVFY